ncbi:MAG: hypothetical protein QF568_01665 [Flavobacteriales bacterium]|jgi:hypothetical protein|nr:hypothetical protein [Flavobacteriales bacterium]
MRVKLTLFVIVLFLLSSCTYPQYDGQQGKTVTYVIEEPQPKVFVIEEEDPLAWFEETKYQRYQQNLRRYTDEDKDELEEFEIRSKLKNVRRIVEDDFGDKELLIGYDKEPDNPDFKKVD